MHRRILFLAFAFALSLTVGISASAAPLGGLNHYHVDPALGSDLTGDGSVAAPWKTITHALGRASTPRLIHLTAGTYSAAGGELFPLVLSSKTSLRGAGQSRTRIDGAGANVVLTEAGSSQFDPTSGVPILQSLTLANALIGLHAPYWPSNQGVADVHFESLTRAVELGGVFSFLKVQRSRFSLCATAAEVRGYGTSLRLDDSVIENCVLGAHANAGHNGFTQGAGIALVRSVVRDCATALRMTRTENVRATISLDRSLISGCTQLARADTTANGGRASCQLAILESTVVDCEGFFDAQPAALASVDAARSILWDCGIAAGVDPDVELAVSECDADVLLSGAGNVSVDPDFDALDPLAYRLAADSPLIDLLPVGASTTDFEGDVRALDGDGDGIALVDVGRDERSSMLLRNTAPALVGTSAQLEAHAGGVIPSCMLLSLSLAPAPIQLDAANWLMIDLSSVLVQSCKLTPATYSVNVPNQLALVGLLTRVQAGGLAGARLITSNLVSLPVE